jgi:hypothetical protein
MTNSPSLFVALTVVLELEWVLRAFYRFEPAQIVRALGHLLGKIVEHVRERVASVLVPDLVFISGDLANRGVNQESKACNAGFIAPLRRPSTSAAQRSAVGSG